MLVCNTGLVCLQSPSHFIAQIFLEERRTQHWVFIIKLVFGYLSSGLGSLLLLSVFMLNKRSRQLITLHLRITRKQEIQERRYLTSIKVL